MLMMYLNFNCVFSTNQNQANPRPSVVSDVSYRLRPLGINLLDGQACARAVRARQDSDDDTCKTPPKHQTPSNWHQAKDSTKRK
jgi:hypothetical protein